MEKIAVLFAGQGSQFVEMGKSFYQNFDICKKTYEEASDAFGNDVAKLCFEGGMGKLNKFTNMQIAIVVTGIAIYRAYTEEYGVFPQFAAGHSIGEYAALTAAGAITLEDVVKILKVRGELVERLNKEQDAHMTIVDAMAYAKGESMIKQFGNKEKVFVSCKNSSSQFALSGYDTDMDEIEKMLIDNGASVSPLLFSPAMHSPVMREIENEFKDFLSQIEYFPFRYPIIANVTGKPFSDSGKIPELMSKQLVNPVLWVKSMQTMYKYGITMSIEMAPKKIISKFFENDYESIKNYCYSVKKEKQIIDHIFNGDSNYQKDMPNFIGRCMALITSTPNYNEDNGQYKREVVESYQELKNMYDHLGRSGLNLDSKKKAYSLLTRALDGKQLPEKEKKAAVKQLLDETNSIYLF